MNENTKIELKENHFYLDEQGNLCKTFGRYTTLTFRVEHYKVYSNGSSSILYHYKDGKVNVKKSNRDIVKELTPEEYPEYYI